MNICIVTGEPSGDLHGANLARALQTLDPSVTITGVGGTRMRQAGIPLIAESEHWGAIGIPDALRKVPGLLWQLHRLRQYLRKNSPDVLVLIDFGAFNVRLLHGLQGSGIRTVYYIPPGCWSRTRVAGQLPFLVDAIATPFPWSAENLQRAQASSTILWVGHPILEYTRSAASKAEARRLLGITDDRPVVALLPGSRKTEIQYLLPHFLASVQQLHPSPHCLLSIAPSISKESIRKMLPEQLQPYFLDGMDYRCIPAADAAIVASGTATLELACLNIPMVVAYRGSFATWIQYQIVLRTHGLPHIALPNILAARTVVPELLQEQATAQTLATAITPLLGQTPEREMQLRAFTEIQSWLGDGHTCARTAQLVLAIANRNSIIPQPPAAPMPVAPVE